MTLMAGNILEGRIINITNFGAFVEVEGKTGLVHISEVADTYVKDIREHLKEDDKVKVKVISVEPADFDWNNEKKAKPKQNFEDIMSKFLKDSEERLQDVKKHQDVKQRKRKSI